GSGLRVIVLDTNVIAEILRPSPEARVVDWLTSLTGASRSRPSPSPNCSRACGGSLMAGARIHRRDGFGSALGAVARYCPSTTWPLTIVLTCSWPVSQQGRRSAPISTADAQI